MEKKEKLKAVAKMIKAMDLSAEEVISYLQGNEQLPTDTQEKDAVTLRYRAPKKVLPGMYVYADGQISAEIIEERQIMAVVGSVEGNEVLAVCLKEKELFWSDAAQYCRDYVEDGVKQGEAFLPSITELERLYENKPKIDRSLRALNVSEFRCGAYWSSTESASHCAWELNFYSGGRYAYNKYDSYYVRPVIALTL